MSQIAKRDIRVTSSLSNLEPENLSRPVSEGADLQMDSDEPSHVFIFTSRELSRKEKNNLIYHKNSEALLEFTKQHVNLSPGELKQFWIVFDLRDDQVRTYVSRYREQLLKHPHCYLKSKTESRRDSSTDWIRQLENSDSMIGVISEIIFIPLLTDLISFMIGHRKLDKPLSVLSWIWNKVIGSCLPDCVKTVKNL